MRFDIDRLSKLAGVSTGERSTLTEASNRSYHDGVASDTAEERFGKNQLNELEDGREPLMQYEDEDYETGKRDKRDKGSGLDPYRGDKKGDKLGRDEGAHLDEADDESCEEAMKAKFPKATDDQLRALIANCEAKKSVSEEDVMLEIDEGMLRKEILRMKRERLQETRLRGAIRNEIKSIFASLTNDSSWVYGDDKPKKSRKGAVHMGFPGIGFKNK